MTVSQKVRKRRYPECYPQPLLLHKPTEKSREEILAMIKQEAKRPQMGIIFASHDQLPTVTLIQLRPLPSMAIAVADKHRKRRAKRMRMQKIHIAKKKFDAGVLIASLPFRMFKINMPDVQFPKLSKNPESQYPD